MTRSGVGAAFKDNFSGVAEGYARHRPSYPAALFEGLAALAPRRGTAWDCGCGSGQASLGLAEVFATVEATDASARQIAAATPHPRIRYRTAPAEASGLPGSSMDLVLAAQAIHWFDIDGFYAEARRVAAPGAILAILGYGLMRVAPAIDAVLDRLHDETLGPYWPKERWLVIGGYRDLDFPFAAPPEAARLLPPDLAMGAEWDLDEALGYLATWSALAPFRAAHGGADPLAPAAAALRPLWHGRRRVAWPLTIRLGRLDGG